MTPLGIHLQKLRKRHNVSQESFANAIGFNVKYLSSIENGSKGIPSAKLIKNTQEYFNLNPVQSAKLQQDAEDSHRTIKLPNNVDPDIYRIASMLKRMAPELPRNITATIKTALEETLNQQQGGRKK